MWALKPKAHLEKANKRAGTHEVSCFDHATGTYQVEHRGGTTYDSEVRVSMMHVVILQNFTCTCGKPRQYHFLCSHLVAAARHRNYNIESRIPHEFSVRHACAHMEPPLRAFPGP